MPNNAALFKREDLQRVTIDSHQWIGNGQFGHVFLGRAFFKPKGTAKQVVKRVAVKVFEDKISLTRVRQYERIIRKLEKEGIKLPKTGFHLRKENNEWVQVQQLFAKEKRSKIRKKLLIAQPPDNEAQAQEHGKLIAQILNAGYDPYAVKDAVGKFYDGKGIPQLLVHDFDSFIPANEHQEHRSLPKIRERMDRIALHLSHEMGPVALEAIQHAIDQNLKSQAAKAAFKLAQQKFSAQKTKIKPNQANLFNISSNF